MTDRRQKPLSALIIGAALFLVSAAVYTACLSPDWGAVSAFNTWDGLEYTLCAALLGIDHPPGHPLYLLLGKIATLWPGSAPSRMINMLSAVSGAIAVVLLYGGLLGTMRRQENAPPLWWSAAASAALSLGFGFSYVFWSHCEIAEVHTLFIALLAGTIAAILRWQAGRRAWLNVAALLAGLAVGVNLLATLAALPPLILFVLLVNRRTGDTRAPLLVPLLICLCGFLIYLYYPVRMASAPFSHPMNLMAPHPAGSAGWYAWYVSGRAWTGGTMFFMSRIGFNLGIYARFLLRNIGVPLLLLALIGFIFFCARLFSLRQSKPLAWPAHLTCGLLLTGLFVFFVIPELSIHDPSNPYATDYLANFFLPSLLILFYWAAVGLSRVHAFLFDGRDGVRHAAWEIAAAACLFAYPCWQFGRNVPVCNLSSMQGAYLMARAAVTRLPAGSLILSKLVYPQAVAYFSLIEPLLPPETLELVNPDVVAARMAREPAPGNCAVFARKNRALLEMVEKAMRSGRAVYIAGDAAEMEKSPERMLLADLRLGPALPLPPVPGAPKELHLYRVEGLREARPSTAAGHAVERGIANDGTFANGMLLRGYSRAPFVEPGFGGYLLDLDLIWEARRQVDSPLYVMVNVLNGRMQAIPGAAAWYTLGGRYSPARWPVGEPVEERVACLIPPLKPGNYFLALGLFECDNNRVDYLPERPAPPGRSYDYVLVAAFRVPPSLYRSPRY